jgi:hypothetical protein
MNSPGESGATSEESNFEGGKKIVKRLVDNHRPQFPVTALQLCFEGKINANNGKMRFSQILRIALIRQRQTFFSTSSITS